MARREIGGPCAPRSMKSATQLAIQIALGVNYLSGLQPLCTPPKPTLCQIPPCVRQAWRPTLAKQLRDFFGGRFVLATIKVEMAFAARQSSLPLRPSASTWVGRWACLRRNTPKKSPSAMRAQAFFLATVRFEFPLGSRMNKGFLNFLFAISRQKYRQKSLLPYFFPPPCLR